VRVVAILAAYNEERFIGGCLDHLIEQGVEAYLIDNSSKDRTVEVASRYLGRGLIDIETFPRDEGVYKWRPILERKQELAASLDADWFMHADPDEIRLPPHPDQTLAEAFAEVDARGYNAVNFLEFTFVPTREAPDHDHPDFLRTMRHYYPFMRDFPNQIKAWKRQPERVDLARRGGHRVNFPDICVYPESFKMRHYPYLGVAHVVRKYAEKEYDRAELRQGWHGYRAEVVAEKIGLPSQAELHTYTTDGELDSSNPRTRHILQDWVGQKKMPNRQDRSAGVEKKPAAVPRPPAKTGRARPGNREVLKEKIGGAGRSLSLRWNIAASRRKILRATGESTDVTFITGRGNIGDHLIHAGARRLLAGVPYKEVQIWRDRKEGIRGLDRLGGHTALVTGGGGWCKPFHWLWPEVFPRIEELFERVVVLPSTVDTSFGPVREVLSETKALFFARERESYRQLQELCQTGIALDTAFFYDFGPYKRHRSEGLLRAYRTDAEAAGGRIPRGNDDISLTCATLDEFLWRIARHQAVETDRAHVMIAAAMLGKEVRYRATNYHKVPAIADYSLKGFPVRRMPNEGPQRTGGPSGDAPGSRR